MGPIRGQTRPMPIAMGVVPKVQRIDAKLNASIHNRFDVEVIDSATGEVRQRAQAENIICNQLWDYLGAGWNNYIAIGTGTGTPSASDKSLFNHLDYYSQSNETITRDNANHVVNRRCKCTLSETEQVGKTITEVGILQSTSSNTLCTHALLKDMNGNNISIMKTDTDIINIYCTVFVHFSSAETENIKAPLTLAPDGLLKTLLGRSTFSSVQYAYLSPGMCDSYGVLVPLSGSFNKDAKALKYTATRVSANQGNTYPILYAIPVSYDGNSDWFAQFIISSLAMTGGTDVTSETIGTGDGATKAFSTHFPFASAAKIYVNGVEQTSGVKVLSIPTQRKLAQQYFHGTRISDLAPVYLTWDYQGKEYAFYNPYYEIGISQIIANTSYAYVVCSDNLTDWVSPITDSSVTTGNTYPVIEAYQHYKYWKPTANHPATPVLNCADNNIVFDTAPATGTVIIADYHTPAIAKDTNHVFDFSFTVQLGEYTA